MKFILSLACLSFAVISAIAQDKCGTDEQYAWLMQHNVEYARLMQKRLSTKAPYTNARLNGVPDTIPVVVHVIYMTNWLGTFGNVPDSSIYAMINSLNQKYNDLAPDAANMGLYFKLAQTDPSCRPTNGIVRVDASDDQTYVNGGVQWGTQGDGISQEQLAAKSYWDNTKYLNIWIVVQIAVDGIAAFAYYPTGTKTVYDGLVLKFTSLHTAVHEMGHAFNLRHTFDGSIGNACPLNNNCNTDGDLVCDTPPVTQNTLGCDPAAINPCTNQPFGNVNYNYMSYNCWRLFTPMQRDRAINALYTYRSSLLTSNTESPPPSAPSVTIASDDADNIITKNQLVTFTPTVTANPGVQYHWLKNSYEISTDPIYRSSTLAHGDEIYCMLDVSGLSCHPYSNTIKISTREGQYVDIYPNPVSNYLTAWTTADDIKINMIRLFTADGKLIEEIVVDPSTRVKYSMEGRPAGIYIIEFTTNKGRSVVRVLKWN